MAFTQLRSRYAHTGANAICPCGQASPTPLQKLLCSVKFFTVPTPYTPHPTPY
ncbi:MAG: hypothetical protein F6J93_11995 [Oscillatoria sp. SIO1A7]|nr:hypothetical protein [Oscillatoria sp. SIO1A7]